MLWLDPGLARGTLRFLAAHQAQGVDPVTSAQPGKILHERRRGEMARLHEVPFGRYYGTVDATPLFVMLAGMYHDRTGDLNTVRELWPSVRAALDWIDRYGDRDGDGFVEWASAAPFGLLAAVLGIDFDPHSGHVIFRHPRLPDPLDQVRIRNLRIGSGAIEILLRRYGRDVAVNVLDKTGAVEVEVLL
jgi:glycogen debranching enzyme